MADDYFAILHLDLTCDDPARIKAAVAQTRARCSQGTMSGLDRMACEQLLARLPAIEAALLDPGTRKQAREEARRRRAAARAARLSAFREDLAMLLAGARESLTEPEREHLLRAHAVPEGPTAAELAALIGVPVVPGPQGELARAQPLAPHEAREIARNLALLGKADLYEFLDLPAQASSAEISTRRDELALAWARKARATAEKGATQVLLGRVATVLLDPVKRGSYAATLRATRLEPLLRTTALALAEGRLSAAKHAHLLARAESLGISAAEAETAILAAATAAGAPVEVAAVARAVSSAPPSAATSTPAAAPPKLIATFNATTGWAGKTITWAAGRFTLEGHGPVSAADVLSYDARGYISWAHEGLRDWVVGLVPASPTETSTGKPVVIGDPYQGGILAYILQAGDPGYVAGQAHGLIAAAADQCARIKWALAAHESVPPGTGTALGTGSANTDKIIAQNGVGSSYAAGLARACTEGGYSDWHLPSKDELNNLYLNRAAVRGLAFAGYWNSSEYDALYAWGRYFVIGYQGYDRKGSAYRVRAVRAF